MLQNTGGGAEKRICAAAQHRDPVGQRIEDVDTAAPCLCREGGE